MFPADVSRWSEIFLIQRCDVGVPWRCAEPCWCVHLVLNTLYFTPLYITPAAAAVHGALLKCWTNWKRQRFAFIQSVGYAITVSKAASTETACQHNAACYINFRAQLFPAAHLSLCHCWRAVDSSFASVTASASMQQSLLSACWPLGWPLTLSLST